MTQVQSLVEELTSHKLHGLVTQKSDFHYIYELYLNNAIILLIFLKCVSTSTNFVIILFLATLCSMWDFSTLIEPELPVMEARSLNHRTAREVPIKLFSSSFFL